MTIDMTDTRAALAEMEADAKRFGISDAKYICAARAKAMKAFAAYGRENTTVAACDVWKAVAAFERAIINRRAAG